HGLGRCYVGAAELLSKDGRRRAVTAAQVSETRFERSSFGVMVHYQIHSSQWPVEIGGLHIDESQPSAVLVQIFVGDLVNLNIQQANHGKIFRPCDAAKGYNRSRRTIASEQFTQS